MPRRSLFFHHSSSTRLYKVNELLSWGVDYDSRFDWYLSISSIFVDQNYSKNPLVLVTTITDPSNSPTRGRELYFFMISTIASPIFNIQLCGEKAPSKEKKREDQTILCEWFFICWIIIYFFVGDLLFVSRFSSYTRHNRDYVARAAPSSKVRLKP